MELHCQQPLFDRIGRRAGIETLLHYFYADVRQHRLLGPIFKQAVSDWPAHLAVIADFWQQVTGGPALYSGNMPAKHHGLGIGAHHVDHWLDLWEFNCRRQLPKPEADQMTALARQIGRRLLQVLNGKQRLSIT